MTTETEWRAEQYAEKVERGWRVYAKDGDSYILMIADFLDEPTARLIAAAPARAALCEELADALEEFCRRRDAGEIHSNRTYNQFRVLLTKAGRSPQ